MFQCIYLYRSQHNNDIRNLFTINVYVYRNDIYLTSIVLWLVGMIIHHEIWSNLYTIYYVILIWINNKINENTEMSVIISWHR